MCVSAFALAAVAAVAAATGLQSAAEAAPAAIAETSLTSRAAVDSSMQARAPRRRLPIASTGSLALVGGALIDGSGGPPLDGATVVIQSGRIAAVGRLGEIAIPAAATIIETSGHTVLPGIINAHVHSGYRRTRLETWAWEGVTTVRDLGGPRTFDVVAELARKPALARIVAAGPFITVPGGYPIVPWGSTSAIAATSAESAAAAANSLLDEGAALIKVAVETGAEFGRSIPTLSLEQLRAVVAVAHARGVPVSAHITRSIDLPRALDGGVDDIAHMVVDRVSDALIARMVQTGTLWVPTLELWHGVRQGRDTMAIENLRRFAAAGGAVALGTDFDGYTTPFQLGMPILEMELMLASGMSPMAIIVAATRNAARACGHAADLGTVEPGKVADLIVVQGDPLANIHALANAKIVIHGGVVIRDEISASSP